MAKHDPNMKAMVDCLDENATPEQLEAYFSCQTQTLPQAAFPCFDLAPDMAPQGQEQ